MTVLFKALCGLSLFSSLAAATPTEALAQDFADPSIVYDPKSLSWYAFATAGNGENVQIAHSASSTGPWNLLKINLLPNGMGSWAVNTGIWAPDVRYLKSSDSYVIYYSAPYAANTKFHCVGAATSENIEGPYTPTAEAFACPTDQGGAIDPSGYYDEASNTRWVVYKVDGNSLGTYIRHLSTSDRIVSVVIPRIARD